MGHAATVGIVRLHMRASKDRDDPILQIVKMLVAVRTDRRIGQSMISTLVVVLVEGDDQKAVMRLCPLVIGIEILP